MKRFLIILVLIVTCFIIFSQDTDTIIVEDSDNVYLGRLLGYDGSEIAVITDSGYYYVIDVETGIIPEILYLSYDSTDCSGIGYIPGFSFFPDTRKNYIYRYGNNYYLKKSDPSSDHQRSRYYPSSEECYQNDQTIDLYYYDAAPSAYRDIIEAIVPPLVLY